MKSEFTKSWIRSVQPRKQRKYRFNAPLHIRHRFLSAPLSKDLRKKHGKKRLPLRKGDEVLIQKGSFAKKTGKIVEVNVKRSRVTIEGITRKKIDGTKVNAFVDPSNLVITSLNIEDSRRLGMKDEKKEAKEDVKGEVKENKGEKKDVSEKK